MLALPGAQPIPTATLCLAVSTLPHRDRGSLAIAEDPHMICYKWISKSKLSRFPCLTFLEKNIYREENKTSLGFLQGVCYKESLEIYHKAKSNSDQKCSPAWHWWPEWFHALRACPGQFWTQSSQQGPNWAGHQLSAVRSSSRTPFPADRNKV